MAKKIDDSMNALDVQSMTSETGMTSDNAQPIAAEGETLGDVPDNAIGGADAQEAEAEPTDPDETIITIATASGKRSAKWNNSTLSFREFKDRLRNPYRTSETAQEYAVASSERKHEIKDIGGFVGGASVDGFRRKNSIATRTLFTADLDHATKEFIEDPESAVDFAAVLYSTHGHTLSAPRVRICAPMSRECTAAEFSSVARQIAQDIGASMFDDCSYTANQFMFWPSCPIDGEYYFKEIDGPILDVDDLLKRRAVAVTEDGQKALTEKQQGAIARNIETIHAGGNKPQNPREKKGIIGAVCRAYSISEGIAKFLPDCYEYAGAAGNGQTRYTWKRGGGFAGLVVYDDVLAYSYHGTDAANDGHEKNIFDLITVHLFNGDTHSAIACLSEDPLVIRQIIADRRAETLKDFKDESNCEDQSDQTWIARLKVTKTGRIETGLSNCRLILENDTRFRGFALNTMANAVEVTEKETIGDQRNKISRPLPWTRDKAFRFWKDTDRAHLISMLDMLYARFSAETVDTAFTDVTDTRRFNPLQDWLNSLPKWDGVPRVDTLLSKCLGAEQSAYTAAVLRKVLLAAVVRVYAPGEKFDYVPVLDGAQGIGKSTFWRVLAGEDYFTDSLTLEDMNDKTGAEKIQGFWFAELAELAGMSKADIRKMRSFITRKHDDFRAAYARNSERRPRMCILVGTVNGDRGYLNDPEGNRRFWPVKCSVSSGRMNWKITPAERDQIWAEILDIYDNKYFADQESLEMDTEELRRAETEAQNAAIEIDDRESRVERYLDYPLPIEEEWDKLTIGQRNAYFDGYISGLGLSEKRRIRDRVCGLEIWMECFRGEMQRYGKKEQQMVAQMMKRLENKWEKTANRGDFGPYGRRAIEYKRVPFAPVESVWIEPEQIEFKPEPETEENVPF